LEANGFNKSLNVPDFSGVQPLFPRLSLTNSGRNDLQIYPVSNGTPRNYRGGIRSQFASNCPSPRTPRGGCRSPLSKLEEISPLEENEMKESVPVVNAGKCSFKLNATIQGYQLIDWRNASLKSNNTSSRSSYSMQTRQNFSYRNTNLSALQQKSSTYRSSPISSDSRCLMPLTSRASPVRIRSAVPVFSGQKMHHRPWLLTLLSHL